MNIWNNPEEGTRDTGAPIAGNRWTNISDKGNPAAVSLIRPLDEQGKSQFEPALFAWELQTMNERQNEWMNELVMLWPTIQFNIYQKC